MATCYLCCVRWLGVWLALFAAFNCNRIYSYRSGVRDASDPEAQRDATAVHTPFGARRALSSLNTAGDEDDPSLTADLLEIYFERDRNIWRALRRSITDDWGQPLLVSELSSSELDSNPEVSLDGLTLHLSSTRGGVPLEIFESKRSKRGDAWSVPRALSGLNSASADCCTATTPDSLHIVMSSDRPGGRGELDLFVSTRQTESAGWAVPQALAEVNSESWDASPWLNNDGTVLFFASRRGGGQRLFFSIRDGIGAPFATPLPVRWPASEADQWLDDPWLSADLTTIYFSQSDGEQRDLYRATR